MLKKKGKTRVPKSQIAEKSHPIDLHIQSEVSSFCATELGFAPLYSKTKKKKNKKKNKKEEEVDENKEVFTRLERRAEISINESLEENEKKSLLQWVEKCLKGEKGERSEKEEILSNGHGDRSDHDRSHTSNGVTKASHNGIRNNSSTVHVPRISRNVHSLGANKDIINAHLTVENGMREKSSKAQALKESFCNLHSFKTNSEEEEESSLTIENGVRDNASGDLISRTFHSVNSFEPYIQKEEEESSLRMQDGMRGHCKKRKRVADKVLDYVIKRCLVLKPFPSSSSFSRLGMGKPGMTVRTTIIAWEKHISVTVTSESSIVREWIRAQNGNLYGLDVEWRPNRIKGLKDNKVALLQLCGENECLIVQMLYLDQKPPELANLLNDPDKCLAGVGVCMDGKRLLNDHGLSCQGTIELTTLAVERLKREELGHVGLKVLVQEVLGVQMEKRKSVTMSNWAQRILNDAQVEYACIDAFVSYALCQKLLGR